MKRGQITIFIILGVLFLILIIFIIFTKNLSNQNQGKINPNIHSIYSYVSDCIKNTLYDSLFYIADTGGYFVVSNLSNADGTAYYYIKGENLAPSNERVADEISQYVNNFLPFCTGDFSSFKDFEINSTDKIKTSTKIEDNFVIVNVEYQLSIKKGIRAYNLENFNGVSVPVRLGIILNVSKTITDNFIEDKTTCISCISDLAKENNLSVNMVNYDNKTLLFIITDPLSKVYDQNYSFYFATTS